jgi:UDP-N-acetylmuramate--alanine ligase
MNIQLANYKFIYFLGIGGIGMSALARYFNNMNFIVKGYDKTPTPLTDVLQSEGIEIHFEDLNENVLELVGDVENTLIVLTPAIPSELKEWNLLKEKGFTILKRSEVLGVITQNSKGLCVAGTHGKTTTSTLLAHILKFSGHECNAFLGGISSNYNTNYLASNSSEYTVIEADEFDRSFLRLSPFASIITSTDPDHLDVYGDEAHFLEGFQQYANLVNDKGCVIMKKGLGVTSHCKSITYALNDSADYCADNLHVKDGFQYMDVYFDSKKWSNVKLGLPGIHNAENALACIAMCHFLGLTEEEIRNGISSFSGVKRRFEYHIRENNLIYIDDYAHHPTEIKAFIDSVRLLYPGQKLTAIFQPHLFSRTKDFMEGFIRELGKVDELILMPIYPARELPIENITSDRILSEIHSIPSVICDHNQVIEYMKKIKSGVVVTIGAGNIDKIIEPLKNQLLTNLKS